MVSHSILNLNSLWVLCKTIHHVSTRILNPWGIKNSDKEKAYIAILCLPVFPIHITCSITVCIPSNTSLWLRLEVWVMNNRLLGKRHRSTTSVKCQGKMQEEQKTPIVSHSLFTFLLHYPGRFRDYKLKIKLLKIFGC